MKININNQKATVIIVNFNNAKYLSKCVNSILRQDYKNKEIIIVDDNSSDNSIEIIKKYIKRVKLIKNKKKTGISFYDQMNAYNLGYKKSKGEIIFFLDSDDFFHKNKISIIMNYFLNNKKKDIIFDLPIKLIREKKIFVKFKSKILKNYWPFLPPTSCFTMKKSYFKKIFKLISNQKFINIWMDFRIVVASKYLFEQYNVINKNLTFYRQTNTNISSKFKFLSKNWWIRRKQAHSYIKFFFKKNNICYKKNIDYFITEWANFFIR